MLLFFSFVAVFFLLYLSRLLQSDIIVQLIVINKSSCLPGELLQEMDDDSK